jgi:regulator of protease activity HflC (stomatin/prohibitin superfamily)
MSSAIVRSQIANSSIDEIMKNRQGLKEKIIAEMNTVVQGWGVHLSTVEITDVRILSGSLFKDMQSKFREENNKKATIERMVVENTIYFDRLGRDLEAHKRNADTELIGTKAQYAENLKQTRREVEVFK